MGEQPVAVLGPSEVANAAVEPFGDHETALSVINGLAGREATLSQLQHACENTYARIIAARNDDRYGTEAASRQRLLDGLKHVYSNLTEEWPSRTAPVQTSEQANNASLIEASVEGEDPLWEPLLEPVIGYAESLPYAISHWIRHHADSRL